MKKIVFILSAFICSLSYASFKAPEFSGIDLDGNKVVLSDLTKNKDQIVVLEWLNHGCPFVKAHYDTNNMQNTQKKVKSTKGPYKVKWISIVSSAKGKQGYDGARGHKKTSASKNSNADLILMDSKGIIGKAYQAKTTPHMFVISPKGEIVYNGAIDNDDYPFDNKEKKESRTNFVIQAVSQIQAKKKITKAFHKPYGCSVKY